MSKLSENVDLAFARSKVIFAKYVAVQKRLTFVSNLLKLNQTIADRIVWEDEYCRVKNE